MNGIDISNYQALLNLEQVATDFVIIKTTEGIHYVNPSADQHFQQAKALGRLLGIYHFMTADNPIEQADYFISQSQEYIGQVLLVLDFEAQALTLGVAGAKQFLDHVRTVTGVAPLIYMSKSTIHQFDWAPVAVDYALWSAQYASTVSTGYQSAPWSDDSGWGAWSAGPVLYQYSANGDLPGYVGDLDLDLAYMDATAWHKYVQGSQVVLADKVVSQITASSAIEQFQQVGGLYTAYNPIRVDAVQFSNGIWQFANYALAGVEINGMGFDWTKNGIPLQIISRVDGGDNNNVQPGAMVAFEAGYNHGKIDQYDLATGAVGINFVGYGLIWFNALALLGA
ncbi:lyzozyme M1 [Weissella oryzae SG25]|uniref:Lyzozyme M1 n=1 Tax=Weissella oryzae (strain DSM 25784 / JCM 18191 / LMG 30913 / SG25) TaxID=1329250 RepID=A0A069CST0_WEIOS|nr:GH25 family lysozyme [Weissella oryzae]GAK30462.1 lyzozyme M1 [Weissella oryzae SG25]